PAVHKTRAKAHQHLTETAWPFTFELFDASWTGVPLAVCHPFFDLRLMNFFLSIPPFPWCICKELLRSAMIGMLPEDVRLRPKAPFPLDPGVPVFRQLDPSILARYTLPEVLDPYIRRNAVPALTELRGQRGNEIPWVDYRPYSFAYWIQQQTCSC